MISEIIQIPVRKNPVSAYYNYWICYEESYQNNFKLDDFKFNNIKSENDIFEVYNDIENLKYNFYKKDCQDVLNTLIINYMTKYLKTFENKLSNEINEFLLDGKMSNFHKIFLSLNLKCNSYFLEVYANIFNKHIDKIKENDKEIELIKFMLNFNKLIDHITKIDNTNALKQTLIKNISSFNKIILHFIRVKGTSFYDDLLNKPYYNKLFKNDKLIDNFDNDSILELHFELFSNLKKNYSMLEFKTPCLAKNLLNIIKISNIVYNKHGTIIKPIIETYNEEVLDKLNSISNYFCATLYYWINTDSIINIFNIIKYYERAMPNKLEFLSYYKYHLQKRVTHKLNYNFENKVFEYLLKEFDNTIFKKHLDAIKNSLDDVYLSEHMNSEISKLNITFKNPDVVNNISQMKTNYNINKLDVFISSNIFWNENNQVKFKENAILADDVDVYNRIVTTYYKSKYEKRELKISNNDSFIDITIGITEMRMPLTYYSVLKVIGNNTSFTIENIIESTKLDIEDVEEILNILKINNIIIEENKNISISQNIMNKTDKRRLNLTQSSQTIIINDLVKKDIDYDKDMLIDSVIMKTCKNFINISYGRLIMILRGELRGFFIPDEKNIKSRLSRLIDMEYITHCTIANIYKYIP